MVTWYRFTRTIPCLNKTNVVRYKTVGTLKRVKQRSCLDIIPSNTHLTCKVLDIMPIRWLNENVLVYLSAKSWISSIG